MSVSLLSSKLLLPPPRSVLVARPRLIEMLVAGAHRSLTLVSASAGFGKTTLVAEWLREAKQAVAWLTLDETDNDPARFLAYFVAALGLIEEHTGEDTLALLQAPQPPTPELLVTTLLNEITAITKPFIFAIDDYHVIQTLAIHQQLAFIVAHKPVQMHLVLLTREDPPLPLPRLRARNQITELRQDDLRFTTQETTQFLENVIGLDISPEDVSALERRTEGWIAGLQLAALSMQGQDDIQNFVQEFTGSNRYVLDYLIEEVFEQQSADTQDFLLKTSILDRLSSGLCEAVTDKSGGQTQLESLEQANLFMVPLDQTRTWYRYHRLFRDLLRNRLRALDPDLAVPLHQRASQWFEKEGFIPEAILHALAASDWQGVTKLLQISSGEMLKRGEVFTLLGWCSQIPENILQADPRLCLEYSWPLILSGQFETAASFLTQAEENAQHDPAFLGRVLTAQAYLVRAQGDHARMIELSQKALSLLSKSDVDSRCMVATSLGVAYWHSGQMQPAEQVLAEAVALARITENHYASMTALVFQGLVRAVRGQLREAATLFEKAIQYSFPIFSAGLANLYLSALYYEWNKLEESTKYLLEAIEIGERNQSDELLVSCWMMMAQLHMASGNLNAAHDVLKNAGQRVKSGKVPSHAIPRLAANQLQVALARDDLTAALRWADQLDQDCDSHPFYRFFNLTNAKLLLAQNKPDAANAYLAQCYKKATQADWRYGQIAVLAIRSLACPAPGEAIKLLSDALRLAQSERFIRTFVDAGEMLVPLLQEITEHSIAPAYVSEILRAMHHSPKRTVIGQSLLVEPLSERELEVLGFVAAGLSNREIAEKLIISPGTAKTHVHNICGKLGVRNRTAAVGRAKELGLV